MIADSGAEAESEGIAETLTRPLRSSCASGMRSGGRDENTATADGFEAPEENAVEFDASSVREGASVAAIVFGRRKASTFSISSLRISKACP